MILSFLTTSKDMRKQHQRQKGKKQKNKKETQFLVPGIKDKL